MNVYTSMKHTLLIWFTFICGITIAQNWDPYVLGQKSYYVSYDSSELIEVFTDLQSGTPEKYQLEFYKFPSYPDTGICIETLDSINRAEYDLFANDNVIVTADTIYFFSPAYPEDSFFILKHVPVGTTWDIPLSSPATDLEYITIRYDSIGIANILGASDSVKYFSLQTIDSLDIPLTIDEARFTLSKDHGLIELVPVSQLLYAENTINSRYGVYSLKGFIKDGYTVGQSAPSWEDFIQLQPGDILKYRVEGYQIETHFARYIITSVSRLDDRIIVNANFAFDGGLYPHQFTYFKSALQYSFPFRGGLYMLAPFQYSDSTFIEDDRLRVAMMSEWKFYEGFLPGVYKDYNVSYVIQPEYDCTLEMPEGTGSYSLNSYVGMIHYAYSDEVGYSDVSLVGSVLSGNATGNYWPVEITDSQPVDIQVWPNPAITTIQVEISELIDTYVIYSVDGKIALQVNGNTSALDISQLKPGMYMIQIAYNGKLAWTEFVKQ